MKTRNEFNSNDNHRRVSGAAGNSKPEMAAALPSAFEPSSELYRVVRKETKPIFPDRTFTLAAAHSNSGEPVVATHHRNLFFSDEARAAKHSVLRSTIADIQENIASGERHEAERARELNLTRRDRDEDGGKLVWRFSTRVLVTAMFVFAVVYVFAEVRNGMLFCKLSGIAELKGTLSAALLSLVPCTAVGVFLKLWSFQFRSDHARWIYHCVVGAVGLVAALAAIPLFATTYSSFLRDPVEAMMSESRGGFSPAFTIGVQILLCSVASAALLIFGFAIIEHHRSPIKRDNPAWLKVKKDLDQISRMLRQDRELVGFAQGKLDALNAELNTLISQATAAYRLVRQSCEATEQRAKEGAEALNRMLPPQKK